MRVGKDGAVATRVGLARLGFALCAWGLAAEAPGQGPVQPTKTASGVSRAKVKKPAPTYTKDVAAILRSKCQNCHRRHQVGPFALETYEQARKRSHDIAAVTEERSMPPWKPTAGVGPKLKHDQSLTRAEIAVLTAWAEAGARGATPRTCRRRPSSPRVGSWGRPT